MKDEIKEVHIKSYDEWLKYYENATKEQVIEDLTRDVEYFADAVKDIKYLQEENEKVHKDFDELSEKYFFTKSRNEKAIEYNKQKIQDIKDFYRSTKDIIYSGDVLIEILQTNIDILQGSDEDL